MHIPPIAVYCSSSSWGGLEMNTCRLAVWLSQRGGNVTLFCLADSPILKAAEKQQVPVTEIRRNKRYFDLFNAARLRKQLIQKGIRFLILTYNRDLDFGGLVKLLDRCRLHLIYQQHMMLGITKKNLIHTFRFRMLDAWITILPYMEEEIRQKTRFPAGRIHLIPLGLDVGALTSRKIPKAEARRILDIPPTRTFLGILGRLDRQKGQHVVIEALSLLRKNGQTLSLLVMGESTRNEGADYPAELNSLVRQNGLDEQVIFRGYHEDVSLFYSAVDLFVLGSFGETYGMVTIESMIYGIPVIGSDAGGTPGILGNGTYGWLYKPQDPEDLARKIAEALADPEKMRQKARLAQLYAMDTFSHETECVKIEKLLNKIHSGGSGG
ncbi:MAG: glycosyltransferase family 4 protein [bacterium]